MPDPFFVVVVVGFVALVAYLVGTRGRSDGARRSLGDPPDQVITTRRFSPWGWWGGSELIYRPSMLAGQRGRRRVARGMKRRGDRDATLEGKDRVDRRS